MAEIYISLLRQIMLCCVECIREGRLSMHWPVLGWYYVSSILLIKRQMFPQTLTYSGVNGYGEECCVYHV